MTISDNAAHRAHWLDKAQRVRNTITDLSRAVTIAAGAVATQPPQSTYVALKLAEAYIHLTVAQQELDEAIQRITVVS